jgi:oxygen-dependent protoporphyrinogen oxidase
MKRIVIAGGGIAGLTAARAIRARDPRLDVVVLERARRPGGNIRSQRIDGYLCESGPDGFLDNAPATLALVRDLGLDARLMPSNDTARRRFIFRKGRLHEVPTSPLGLARTPLLSTRGKARIVLEPFARRNREEDESIHRFAQRHIGSEAATVLVGSMVSGIFAGDAGALSLRACFPAMRKLEEEHGSLFRALWATRGKRRKGDAAGGPAGRLTSFEGGMTDLIDALWNTLGDAGRTDSPVLRLRKGCQNDRSMNGPFTVATPGRSLAADAVVLAGPSSESAHLVAEFDPELAGLLGGIPSAPLAVVALGYDAGAFDAARLGGFGFLVPRNHGIRILGTLWETSIYPNRAPEGKVLMRVMIGGACDPAVLGLDDDELLAAVRQDLATTMGLSAEPEFVHIVRHSRGIPQYVTGHSARLARIDDCLARHPGLHLAGNSYRSPSVNACIAEANQIADAVFGQLTA